MTKFSHARALKVFGATGLLSHAVSPALADPGSSGVPITPIANQLAILDAEERSLFSAFTPTGQPIEHTIDYSIWDFALKNIVISMGPSDRSVPVRPIPPNGTRIRQGHDSRYRLEGSMVGFSFLDREVIASFTEHRKDSQSVAGTLDISSLPSKGQGTTASWRQFISH